MKLNLKMIAVAAAMVATGSAHAELVGANIVGGTGSSLVLVAFNSVTNAYYVRDLGFTLNSFLPTGITTSVGDGSAVGTMTPAAGTSFSSSDSAFGTWLAGQTSSDIRWTVTAGDSLTALGQGFSRILLAATTPFSIPVSNGTVRNASSAVTGLLGQNPGMGLSATGATVLSTFSGGNTILQPLTLSLLNAAASLYYFVATTATGSSSIAATATQFGNATGFASVNLASNGDFTYSLAGEAPAAVPVPAAAWLLGSGLVLIGGMIRRRKAAAQA